MHFLQPLPSRRLSRGTTAAQALLSDSCDVWRTFPVEPPLWSTTTVRLQSDVMPEME